MLPRFQLIGFNGSGIDFGEGLSVAQLQKKQVGKSNQTKQLCKDMLENYFLDSSIKCNHGLFHKSALKKIKRGGLNHLALALSR